MLQIQNTLVSLDLIERFFCCDLEECHGMCCVEGDAGAPITPDEQAHLEAILPQLRDDLLPRSIEEIDRNGVAYTDEEGDLVTSIVDGGNCVFATYAPGGTCLCAIEKACRENRLSRRNGLFIKPQSCHLYPVRLRPIGDMTALNFHRWKICTPAEKLGRKLGIRAYQFLREPLVNRFGSEWYDELCLTADEYLRQYGDDNNADHSNE